MWRRWFFCPTKNPTVIDTAMKNAVSVFYNLQKKRETIGLPYRLRWFYPKFYCSSLIGRGALPNIFLYWK